jgi:IS1 family transposase
LPPLEATLLPHEGHDEVIIDELWTFVQAKVHDFWIWIMLSRRNLQVLGFYVGGRDLHSAQQLWAQVPAPWRDDLVFTDGYKVYQSLFQDQPLQHCRCLKRDSESWGETSAVEGVNNALRQGVSYLTRKSLAFARSRHWLQARLQWFIHRWNQRQARKFL